MGVACGNGLVGVVYLTSEHYSVVIPVLNHLSHISVTIRNRGYFGYLTWDGGSPVVAYVEDIPRHAQFKKGDWIETSGYSNIFPAGISVGKIVDIKDSDDGLSYRLKLNLSTDFSCLRDVCVITEQGFAERMQLHEAAVDSMTGRQKNRISRHDDDRFIEAFYHDGSVLPGTGHGAQPHPCVQLCHSLAVRLFCHHVPPQLSRWAILLWCFTIGLVIDAFSNTPGVASASMTLIGALQPVLLELFLPRDADDHIKVPQKR